jgi:hypothetical protein
VKNRCDLIDSKSDLVLSFRPHHDHKHYEVGEFGVTSPESTCPGIPLDPKTLLENEITRVDCLEIEFAQEEGLQIEVLYERS